VAEARKGSPMRPAVGETSKAVTVAASWGKGWGLRVVVPPGHEDADLVIEGMKVRVCPGDGSRCERTPCGSSCAVDGAVVLSAKKLNSRNVDEAVREMWKLTTAVGAGQPGPFRKASSVLRASSDDYEATSLRLTPFQRVPNPPAEVLKKHEPIVRREANRAAKRYPRILQQMSMEEGDLYTAGLVYLCNYLHRYQNLHDEQRNGANLTLSLQQEYRRWATVTCEKLKDVSFCSAGVPITEVVGAPVAGVQFTEAGSIEASYSMDPAAAPAPVERPEPVFTSDRERKQYEKRKALEEGHYIKARQAAHAQELEDLLGGLGHDEYVESLAAVINEERHPVEAREEAGRRMRAHLETCESCRCADEAWSEVERSQRTIHRPRLRRRPVALEVVPTIDDAPVAED
jgi:hypothetical protein